MNNSRQDPPGGLPFTTFPLFSLASFITYGTLVSSSIREEVVELRPLSSVCPPLPVFAFDSVFVAESAFRLFCAAVTK